MKIRQVGEKRINVHEKQGMQIHIHKKDEETAHDHVGGKAGTSENKLRHRNHSVTKEKKERFWGRQLFRVAGYESTKKVADQMDGGEEVQQASMLMYETSRPLMSVANRGN